jgi:hypothetical protein
MSAARRRKDQRQRAANQERLAQAEERLGSVGSRRADDQHQTGLPALDGQCQHARRLVEPGGRAPVEEDGAV